MSSLNASLESGSLPAIGRST